MSPLARLVRGFHLFAVLGLITAGLSACSAGVNDALVATSTPVPVRSPAAATPGSVAAAPALRRAERATMAADFRTAETAYTEAIQLDPGNPRPYAGRGHVHLAVAQGDPARYDAAQADFNRAVVLDSTDLAGRVGRALVPFDRAVFRGDPVDFDRAIAELDRIAADLGEPAVALTRARILATRGDAAGADAARQRADPEALDSVEGQITTAVVKLASRDWDAAAQAATAAIERDTATWGAYRTLAEAELGRGEPAAALAAIDHLLAAWPTDGRSLYLRAVALAATGDVAAARGAFASAAERLTHSPVYLAKITQAMSRLGT